MKWRNKYHKGFNRLWLVVSIIVFFPAFWWVGGSFPSDSIAVLLPATIMISVIISSVTFSLGHVVFLVILWIIQGFRDKN